MKIFPERIEFQPTWVNAKKFDLLWRNSDSNLFIDVWEGEPKNLWFRYEMDKQIGFKTADVGIYIDENGNGTVGFTNGRHRTRWKLQQKELFIPIGLTENGFENAKKLQLEPRRI